MTVAPNLCRKIAVMAFYITVHSPLFAQEPLLGIYQEVPKERIMEYVVEFVDNREKFSNFGCFMESDRTEVTRSGINSDLRYVVVFENAKNKLRRSDVLIKQVRVDESTEAPVELPVMTTFRNGLLSRYFEGFREMNPREDKRLDPRLFKFHFAPDPWMVPITELDLVSLGKGGNADFWNSVFDESKLLWVESNGTHVRGEWKFGRGEGECNVQVYFSDKFGRMPVFVRYILPKNSDERFSRHGITVSENQILWQKYLKGYVPAEVRGQREDTWATKSGVKSTTTQTIKFSWQTKLRDKKGELNQLVFEPGKLHFEEVVGSFVKEKR